MTELTVMDPTGRFTGMAEVYDRNRPNYPSTALDHLARHCTLGPAAVVVDVGCGTGISTRQFAQRGWQAIGVEPNADMRRQAEQLSAPAANPSYREGRAEATGLADGVADLVLAAQAFHWFEPIATLREFHRILKPAGWVALLWNERDEADPCTAAYGQVVRSTSDAARIET
ncbi:MAG: type 11 methyltransferase, partial [bacterium]